MLSLLSALMQRRRQRRDRRNADLVARQNAVARQLAAREAAMAQATRRPVADTPTTVLRAAPVYFSSNSGGGAGGGGSVISGMAGQGQAISAIGAISMMSALTSGVSFGARNSQAFTVPELQPNARIVAIYDGAGRLHNELGPAVHVDGDVIGSNDRYCWHGVSVDKRVIMQPETITIKEIDDAANTEVRRVLIERYGTERFYIDCGAMKIAEDDVGALFVRPFRQDRPNFSNVRPDAWGWDSIVFVRVKNSTPEPDGTFKFYYLRVPPDTRTPREGIAWTFRLPERDYKPKRET